MPPRLLFTLILLASAVLVGCPRSNAEKLIGKWTGKPFEQVAAGLDTNTTLSEEEKAKARQFATMFSDLVMSFEFAPEGKLTMTMSGVGDEAQTETGTYTILKSEDNTISVKISAKGEDGSEQLKELAFTFVDDDTVTVVDAEREKVNSLNFTLTRVKPAE